MRAFRHVVLFRIHDTVPEDDVTAALDELRTLAALPGVVAWRVERSLDARKGRVIVEDATFASADDFERFRIHPTHVAAGQRMAAISDWWNGDYLE